MKSIKPIVYLFCYVTACRKEEKGQSQERRKIVTYKEFLKRFQLFAKMEEVRLRGIGFLLMPVLILFLALTIQTLSVFATTHDAKLLFNDPVSDAGFGGKVATSADGNTAVVTAVGMDGQKGAAYVFRHSGTGWAQEAKLTASDGAAMTISETPSRSVGTEILLWLALRIRLLAIRMTVRLISFREPKAGSGIPDSGLSLQLQDPKQDMHSGFQSL